MRSDELRGLGRLAGRALSGGTRRIEELHQGIAARAFGGVGPAAAPVRVVHDAVATGVYATVRTALAAAATGSAAALAATRPDSADAPRLADSPRGAALLAALNGAHGDLLERDVAELATVMSLRHDGRDLPATRPALAAAHPVPSGRIAVFVHGLGMTETGWARHALRHHGEAGAGYGTLLDRDLGVTPLFVRYNTGRRISANGGALGALLGAVVAAWPVPVTDVVLVGHSMGGLVIRSALLQAVDRTEEDEWARAVRATVALGTPHLGAPLERAANLATHALGLLGETRPIGAVLALRSVGVKDLRYGNVAEADWLGHDPDGLLTDTRLPSPLRDGVHHHAILGTVAGRHDSLPGRLLGDLMVGPLSAVGDSRDDDRLVFPDEHVVRLPGLNHLDLLNHPRVYPPLRAALAAALPGASGRATGVAVTPA